MSNKAVKISRAAAEHGQHIFIYAHVRTNQIIYSLNRAINNNAALKQLPFLGKQTVPATIRKDFWQPLATVSFPSGPQGLSAFQQLREYRKRHEHEWTAPRCKPRKLVGRELRDQKANSIADLAAVLLSQEKVAAVHTEQSAAQKIRNEQARVQAQARLMQVLVEREEARKKEDHEGYKAAKREKMRLKKAMSAPEASSNAVPKRGPGRQRRGRAVSPVSMDGIKIAWANVFDAEFAATWPKSVVHDDMSAAGTRVRNVAPKPVAVKLEDAVTEVPVEEQAAVGTAVVPAATPVTPPVKEAKRSDWDDRTSMQRLVDRLRFGRGQ